MRTAAYKVDVASDRRRINNAPRKIYSLFKFTQKLAKCVSRSLYK